MNDERIPQKALQQTIYGKRAVGKPRKKWEDCIKLLGTKAWKTKAKDRQFWRPRLDKGCSTIEEEEKEVHILFG
jgi:hypothetical protein